MKRIILGVVVVLMAVPFVLGFLWGIVSTGYQIGVISGCKAIPSLMREP